MILGAVVMLFLVRLVQIRAGQKTELSKNLTFV